VLLPRHLRHCSHHGDGTDCKHQIDAGAVVDQLPQLVGDEAFVRIASVVGCNHQRIADLAQFALQNDQFFVASTNDGDHAISLAFQRHRGRISHCGTNTATHHHHSAKSLDLRRFSQRPYHIQNVIASVQRIEHVGGLADRLHHNANRAVLGIGMFDGDRNAFALLVEPQDYELSGFLLVCNAWRLDDEPLDAWREKFSVLDFEHVPPWLASQDIVWKAEPSGCDRSHW
jgi:hypothetical protein